MKLLVFTTHRQLRHFVASHANSFLPKLLTIGDFFDRIIDIETPIVDEDRRKLFLYEAARSLSLDRLGLSGEWWGFLSQVGALYSFLLEMKQEGVEIADIDTSDTYAEYAEHLQILQQLKENYRNILQSHNLTDKLFIQDPPINHAYLEQFSEIELFVEGYLTKFERMLLQKIETPLKIHFSVTRFNKPLAVKMFGIEKEGAYEIGKQPEFIGDLPPLPQIETSYFGTRIDQVDFVFAKIEEFVQSGISPEKIAVILPDMGFKEYLEAFDRLNNLNFSMGDSFIYSKLYRTLEALYKVRFEDEEQLVSKIDEKSLEILQKVQDWAGLKEAIEALSSPKEMDLIQEELFRFSKLVARHESDLQRLWHLFLQRLAQLSFDDNRGGKITVMETLESRGVGFEGVIVVDFNEEYVPKITTEDLFIDSRVRKRSNLPTRSDKEALQKHFYYMLFSRAKRVAISYVKNDKQDASRFLHELSSVQQDGSYYQDALLPPFAKSKRFEPEGELKIFDPLTPTKLWTLLQCPMQYFLRYQLGIKPPSQERFLGTLIHSAIQQAAKKRPKTYQEYAKEIIGYLHAYATREERLQIAALWERKLYNFAKKDFENLGYPIGDEITQSKRLDNFILQARADRVVYKESVMIVDFKTSKSASDKDYLQALFYAYIWDSEEIYMWDLHKGSMKKVETKNPQEELLEILRNLPQEITRSQDEKPCYFCAYRFGCKGEV